MDWQFPVKVRIFGVKSGVVLPGGWKFNITDEQSPGAPFLSVKADQVIQISTDGTSHILPVDEVIIEDASNVVIHVHAWQPSNDSLRITGRAPVPDQSYKYTF